MARSIPASTWENGFKETSSGSPWIWDDDADASDVDAYITPPSKDVITSSAHNAFGINVLRTWPTLFDGTNNPHGLPSWWKPTSKVDVLIIGAGPSGLQIAASLARQNVSFRIIDKGDSPIIAGRADGVQPRFMETVSLWGLADEISEEGPLIERTAIYKDGERLLFNRSHQSDSRYRGLHVVTQGQIERIYIRDLARHKSLVERRTTLQEYKVDLESSHPVKAVIKNEESGNPQKIEANFLVGSDGAASTIRKQLQIPFDGVSTGIYWGIMDCIFESDYPHAWVFGSVISSKHGGCVIIPREDGYIRLYTQLDTSATGPIAQSRQASDPEFAESGGQVDIHSITPHEVLAQANKIFAPYELKFAAPLSWFAIWKISERVARSYSSSDMTTHLVGDAAHVHSVMGAFGLNASIMDAANLAWKLGFVAKRQSRPEILLPTYGSERRDHAIGIIEKSGTYLRFVCGSGLHLPNLRDPDSLGRDDIPGSSRPVTNGGTGEYGNSTPGTEENGSSTTNQHMTNQQADDLSFLGNFFRTNGQFLLGVDCAYSQSVLNPATVDHRVDNARVAICVKTGVRAPNPRVCLSTNKTGYLYDVFVGPPKFFLVLFLSSLGGKEVRQQAQIFAQGYEKFRLRYGNPQLFKLVVVVKCMPFELDTLQRSDEDLHSLWQQEELTVVFDDRPPDEDAHTTWGVNHRTGGLAVIRPDLWVGTTAFPSEVSKIVSYFDGFLTRDGQIQSTSNDH